MRRDGVGTKNRPKTTVTTNSDRTREASRNSPPAPLPSFDTTPDSSLNDTANSTVTGRFYSSYNPTVGINTAVVLGGILSVLVLYVIYRTKCRKRLLGAIESCTMRFMHEEYMIPPDQNATCDKKVNSEKDWISEKAKMIWEERAQFSESELKRKYSEKRSSLRSVEKRSSSVICKSGEANECDTSEQTLQLPVTEENIEYATAQWVQHVPQLDSKDKHLTGIILKIPQDLVSRASRKRCNFLSVTDYGTCEELTSISCRNSSLPLLFDQSAALFNPTCKTRANATADDSVIMTECAPGMSLDDVSTRQGTPPLHVKHQSGARVPLDICPIIKIQHFHSRSKRRLTSLHRGSSDDSMTSESSEDPLLMDTMETKTNAASTQKHVHSPETSDEQAFPPILQPLACQPVLQDAPFQPTSQVTYDKLHNSIKGNLETSL